jgi:hypothetical protein
VNDFANIISRLEQQRAAIDRALSALREVEGPGPVQAKSAGSVATKPKKRRMSAAGRRRIAEATRKRWADKRAADAALLQRTGSTKHATKKAARKTGT